MVISCVCLLSFPVFMSVKHLLARCTNIVLVIPWDTILQYVLLCWLVHKLFMCLFVQQERRGRQLLVCLSGHKFQSGEIFCLRMCILLQLPRYLLYPKFKGLWELGICNQSASKRRLHCLGDFSFVIHFLTFGIVFVAFDIRVFPLFLFNVAFEITYRTIILCTCGG